MFQEFGIALRNLSVDLKARVGPPSDPFTVMKVRVRGSSVTRVGFVIASTGAERARPAFAAISLVRDVVPGQEIGLGSPVYAVSHAPQLVRVRAGETVAKRNIAARGNAQESQSGAARISLAGSLVDFFQRIPDIGESMVPVRNRVVEEFPGQLAELRQHMIETRLVDGIQPVRRSSDRSKAHFPKADLAGQVLKRGRRKAARLVG